MNSFKITCDTGNNWETGFNGTFEQAKAYFMGQSFVRELWGGSEISEIVCKVEII